MPDIFGRRPLQFGGAFAADDAFIRFGSNVKEFGTGTGGRQNPGVGLVTQNIQFSYQQPITRIYEVGTQLTYYIAGRPQGNANAARILGPSRVVAAFYEAFGNVCNAAKNFLWFTFNQGCAGPGAGRLSFRLNHVVLQSIGMSVSAQDMIINEQLAFFFTSLEAFAGAGGAIAAAGVDIVPALVGG